MSVGIHTCCCCDWTPSSIKWDLRWAMSTTALSSPFHELSLCLIWIHIMCLILVCIRFLVIWICRCVQSWSECFESFDIDVSLSRIKVQLARCRLWIERFLAAKALHLLTLSTDFLVFNCIMINVTYYLRLTLGIQLLLSLLLRAFFFVYVCTGWGVVALRM